MGERKDLFYSRMVVIIIESFGFKHVTSHQQLKLGRTVRRRNCGG